MAALVQSGLLAKEALAERIDTLIDGSHRFVLMIRLAMSTGALDSAGLVESDTGHG